ncbi:MAG: PQQ-binding-like beta-propeller repeat protein [Planctomycetota bacterium]
MLKPFSFCLLLLVCFLGYAENALAQPLTGFGYTKQWRVESSLVHKPGLASVWEMEVGEGRAQVIGSNRALIVASGGWADSEKRQVRTQISAHRSEDGKQLWSFEQVGPLCENQQTFGGAEPAPQATPLLLGNRLIYVSFTGQLTCLNANNGEQLWTVDLVQELGAEPVQFGFSSSPVPAPDVKDDFLILAGGERGGLFRFSVESLQPQWVCPIAGFSYSTPTWSSIQGKSQWLVAAQDSILGIAPHGSELWRFNLPERGLTNVPSPLIVDDQHILVSGQGCQGTICISVQLQDEQWSVERDWSSRRLQFFYTNWMMLDDQLTFGSTANYLAVFEASTGNILARLRDFRNGNVIQTKDDYLLLDGTGMLHWLKYDANKGILELTHRYELTKGRCWVPPTLIGDKLFVREGQKLLCLQFQAKTEMGLNDLVEKARTKVFALESTVGEPDPVSQILELFEKKGQLQALSLYNKLRSEKKLELSHRIALTEAAYEAGQQALAQMIVDHAKEDFPDSDDLQRAISTWKGK